MSQEISAGKTYRINHTRKGVFVARLTSVDDVWATGVVVSGKARAMLDYNEREVGEEVTIRRSFSVFEEVADHG